MPERDQKAPMSYACLLASPLASPLEATLSGLPPILIQVGDEEILLSDSPDEQLHAASDLLQLGRLTQ